MIRLRDACVDDAMGIATVQVTGWQTTYQGIVPDSHLSKLTAEGRADMWRRGMSEPRPDQHWIVAETEAGRIIGFIASGRATEPVTDHAGEFYAIYLLPEHRGQGVGTRLLSDSAQRLIRDGLSAALVWVLAANPWRRFYETRGGHYLCEKTITIGGTHLQEVAYGFRLSSLVGVA
ncbi:MAG TPA: GNAT family N-acetyltransferase [Candidatus Ozemobacteraceae bacterium]|nr:GNAT family N-acetyltransferase [Candidatus Ozemobacteraceae bacterium]